MKTSLSLQEKLSDLREERKLNLADVEKATGISKSTLQRFESDEDSRIGYQDVEVLTRFYGVSADYLFGLTDNREHQNTEMGKLHLSDKTIELLMSEKLNNRLLSDLLAHPDFPELLAGLEVFIDRFISENMEIVNKSYKVAIDKVNKKYKPVERREYLQALRESSIDGDAYLRFRLAQRFERIAQSLYDTHKKAAQSPEGEGYIKQFVGQVEKYQAIEENTGSAEQAKLEIFADQMGVNMKKATEGEKKSMLSFLSRSKFAQFLKKRK